MAAALQSALARLGENINIVGRSFGSETATLHLGYDSTDSFNPVSTAVRHHQPSHQLTVLLTRLIPSATVW